MSNESLSTEWLSPLRALRAAISLPLAVVVVSGSLLPALYLLIGGQAAEPYTPAAEWTWTVGPNPIQLLPTVRTYILYGVVGWSAALLAAGGAVLAFAHVRRHHDLVSHVVGLGLGCAAVLETLQLAVAIDYVSADIPPAEFLSETLLPVGLFVTLTFVGGASAVLVSERLARFLRSDDGFRYAVATCSVLAVLAVGLVAYAGISRQFPNVLRTDETLKQPLELVLAVVWLIAGLVVFPRFLRESRGLVAPAVVLASAPLVASRLHLAFGSAQALDAHFFAAEVLCLAAWGVLFSGLLLETHAAHARELTASIGAVELRGRRQAELARRSELARARAVLLASGDAVLLVDESGSILEANRSTESILGVDRDALPGRTAADLCPALSRLLGEPDADQSGTLGVREIAADVAAVGVHASGEEVPVLLSVALSEPGNDEAGAGRLYVALLRDLRARKASEATRSHVARIIRDTTGRLTSLADELVLRASETAGLAETQAVAVASAAASVTEAEEAARATGESARGVFEGAEQARTISESGHQLLTDYLDTMDDASRVLSGVVEQIDDLRRQSEAVEEIARAVGAIADQTNLLALNAAIEASRAGQQGRGFARVAGEIKKLAEDSRTATEAISEILFDIRGQAEQAARTARAGNEKFVAAQDQLSEVEGVIQTLAETIYNSSSEAGQIMNHAAGQSGAMAGVSDSARQLDEATRRLAESSAQSLDVTSRIVTAVEELRRLSSTLNAVPGSRVAQESNGEPQSNSVPEAVAATPTVRKDEA